MAEPLLRELAADVWILDQPLAVFGLHVGARMTVVRLGDGSLFLHSPVRLRAAERAELDALGPVRHVVAPSKVHHFFLAGAREAYPGARVYSAPGLAGKKPDLSIDEELSDEAPAAWKGAIDQLAFRGAPWTNEIAFCHRASRTLILTDLVLNVRESDSWLTRQWLRLNGALGHFGPHRLMRAVTRDRAAARVSIDRILEWDFDRVVMSHGAVVQERGKRLLRESFAWLEQGQDRPSSA